jgi:hypothetical protein
VSRLPNFKALTLIGWGFLRLWPLILASNPATTHSQLNVGGGEMKMDDRYSNASYGSAGLAAFFASLSLQDWGFIIGVGFSIALGVLTYRLNRREQMKRTSILQDILNKTDTKNPSATAQVIADLGQKAPREI